MPKDRWWIPDGGGLLKIEVFGEGGMTGLKEFTK